jgi:hypothetical protein
VTSDATTNTAATLRDIERAWRRLRSFAHSVGLTATIVERDREVVARLFDGPRTIVSVVALTSGCLATVRAHECRPRDVVRDVDPGRVQARRLVVDRLGHEAVRLACARMQRGLS